GLHENIQTITDLQQLSFANRRDLLALQQRENAALTGIKLSHAGYLPNVALTTGYVAGRIPGVLSVSNALSAGVGVSYNLSSLWKTRSKITAANARYRELNENEAQLKDAITLQLNKSFEDFLLQKKKITVF